MLQLSPKVMIVKSLAVGHWCTQKCATTRARGTGCLPLLDVMDSCKTNTSTAVSRECGVKSTWHNASSPPPRAFEQNAANKTLDLQPVREPSSASETLRRYHQTSYKCWLALRALNLVLFLLPRFDVWPMAPACVQMDQGVERP